MEDLVTDVKGKEDLDGSLSWFSVGIAEPPEAKAGAEEGWVQVEVGNAKKMDVGGSSSSASKPADLDAGFHIYGQNSKERKVLETCLRLVGDQEMDRAGLAIYYDRSNWVWAGLVFVGGQMVKTTAGRVDGQLELAYHGVWTQGNAFSIRMYHLGDSCVIEFGSSTSLTGLDITSLYTNMKDSQQVQYDIARVCYLSPLVASKEAKPFAGLCVSDTNGTKMLASFKYLKMRSCASYDVHS